MSEWLECWAILRIIFYLNTAEDILQRRIYRSASERSREIVFTQMERIVELGPDVLVEVVTRRDVKATQGLLFAEHVVDRLTRRVTGEIVKVKSGITRKEFILLVVVLGQSRSRTN